MKDLFPAFESVTEEAEGVRLFARVGGAADAPPLVLLHGFPQTHACWHAIAPDLARHFRVVCLDLKGYGQSEAPHGDGGKRTYSKRTLGRETAAFMEALGHKSFALAGHDRGALVGYRLALDEPERVTALAILDNYPTSVIWDFMANDPSFTPHWRSYARPEPIAEKEMTVSEIETLLARHTGEGTLSPLLPEAVTAYREQWSTPERVHAFCEDYRAGATTDPDLDRADLAARRTIEAPVLVIWGEKFLGAAPELPDSIWRRTFAPNAEGIEVPGGHFNAEEAPGQTLAAMQEFFARHVE
jgi:haloacetate dehalogenase